MSRETKQKPRAYRFLAGLKATLTLAEKKIDCEAIDLNRTGAAVEGELSIGHPTHARLSLHSAAEDLRFEATCRVARITPDEETGRSVVGLEFDRIDPDQAETLELLVSRVVEGMSPAVLSGLKREATVEEIRSALARIPLAHKITLAQRALPLERSFLRHDDNSQVIEALCRNPQLTMPEVVQILRMPSLLPTTLELLSRDARWKSNDEIKMTIATHPRVTYPVAERLAQTLDLIAVRKLIRLPGLHPAIKANLVKKFPRKQLQGW